MSNLLKAVSKRSYLELAKDVLKAFIDERNRTPSDIEKENAYAWIYATSHYIPLMRRPKEHKIHPFYEQSAYRLFNEWDLSGREVCKYPQYCIPPPEHHETLHKYLEKLRSRIVDQGEQRKIWWFSLRSFTAFIRKKARLGLWGDLDIIFPEEMTIYSDTIIRKIPATAYPIDILAVAEILQNLANWALEGSSHSQESAIQALGLAWVCLSCGLSRCLTRLELLHQLVPDCLKSMSQNDPCQQDWMTIPTLFDKQDVPISNILYEFLYALPRSHPHLFGMPLGSLRRALDRAVQSSIRAQKLGKITFLTFMSQPHEAIGYRFKDVAKYQK